MSLVHYKAYKGILLLARNLRNNQTPSEKLLWELLRNRKMAGHKFLRQHPVFYRIDRNWVDFFIADFYCSELKLIIELDGPVHLATKDYDSDRDAKLNSRGIAVLRIKNEELTDINCVIGVLKQVINSRLILFRTNHKSSPLPLPLKGRGRGMG
jgi:very-short-patch-repair endonuclease